MHLPVPLYIIYIGTAPHINIFSLPRQPHTLPYNRSVKVSPASAENRMPGRFFTTPLLPVFYPIFTTSHKSLFFRGLKQSKIQGIYFEISALYFKIYGLYFSRQAMCFFSHRGTTPKTSRKMRPANTAGRRKRHNKIITYSRRNRKKA